MNSKLIKKLQKLNPWDDLLFLCAKRKYPRPTHKIFLEEGPEHNKVYTVECKVGPLLVEYGKGKTVKMARKCSAYLMIECIKEYGPGCGPYQKQDIVIEDDHKIIKEINFFTFPSKSQRCSSTNKNKKSDIGKNLELYKSHLGLTGSALKTIKDPTFQTENPEHFVHELESELNFKAIYWEIIEKTSKNQYQCMVQLFLEPQAVLIGTGNTMAEARKESSEDVLNFFRKMT